MSDISLSSTDYQTENRSWLISQWGQAPGENPSCVVDVSAFTQGTHYPNGFIKSGEPVGIITAASDATKTVVGPYDNAASDGREVCAGFLHSKVKVPTNGSDPGSSLVVMGVVKASKLPRAVDANGKADLKLVYFIPA